MNIHHYNALIFDFGGVLVNLDIEKCFQNFENIGVKNIRNLLNEYIQIEFVADYEKGLIDTQKFFNKIREFAHKEDLKDEDLKKAWLSFLVDVPDEKLKMLLDLRKNKKIYLLSNTNPLHISMAKATYFSRGGHTIDDYFDQCFLSYEMKLAKPSVEIFNKVIETIGEKPEKCLFIDDSKKNIEAAKKIGIGTYLVENGILEFEY